MHITAVAAAALLAAVSAVSADPPGSTLTRAEEPVVIQQSLLDQTGYVWQLAPAG